MRLIEGPEVLDVGCGKGAMTAMMAGSHRVTGADIIIDPTSVAAHPDVRFVEANAERLPFGDRSFDTVVCAHTLEHVRDLAAAMREMRRVARRRLVIVVPKQRPSRFTFDLHLGFFPYAQSLLNAVGPTPNHRRCRDIAGDLLYTEEIGA